MYRCIGIHGEKQMSGSLAKNPINVVDNCSDVTLLRHGLGGRVTWAERDAVPCQDIQGLRLANSVLTEVAPALATTHCTCSGPSIRITITPSYVVDSLAFMHIWGNSIVA